MCGRSALSARIERIVEVTGAIRYEALGHEWKGPNFNVCPGSYVPVLVRGLDDQRTNQYVEDESVSSDGLILVSMRWGLLPSFTMAGEEKSAYKMINARSETVATKNAFRRLVRHRRCVFLCDGFYEWKKSESGSKEPYFIQLKEAGDEAVNGHPFMRIAGLWDMWHDAASDETVLSFTLLTTDPSNDVSYIHDRMPVILDDDGVNTWLDCSNSPFEKCASLMRPYFGSLACQPVAKAVNDIKNKSAQCIESPEKAKERLMAAGIGRFFKPKVSSRSSAGSSAERNLTRAGTMTLGEAVRKREHDQQKDAKRFKSK